LRALFAFFALLESLLLSGFTLIYMAGKGLLLALGSLFILSSLAYAAVATGFASAFARVIGGRHVIAGMAAAAIVHSAALYALAMEYWSEISVFETLGLLLEASNLYAFIASYAGGFSPG